MSIFSSIISGAEKLALPFAGASKAALPILSNVSKVPFLGTALKAIPGIGTAVSIGSIAAPAIKGLLSSSTAKVAAGVAGGAAATALASHLASGGAVPKGYHISKRTGKVVRNRRMNVCNPRAARRAIRRVKGARKMLQQIEKQLPHRTVHSRAPRGGRTIEAVQVRN